jgi:diguanylate cyclase (GGDEF)-like protein
VGFDDIFEAQINVPSITTVRQPLKEQIEEAFDLILNMINKKQISYEKKVSCEFIIRESCGCFENHNKTKKIISSTVLVPKEYESILKEIKLKIYENLKESLADKDELQYILTQLFINLEKDIEEYDNHFANCLKEFIVDKKLTLPLSREIICEMKNNFLLNIKDEKILCNIQEILFNILLSFNRLNERIILQNNLNVMMEKLKLEYMSQYLTTTFNLKNIVNTLKSFLKELKINHFLLCIYNGKVKFKGNFEWKVPRSCKVLLDYRNGKVIEKKKYIINIEDIFPDDFFKNEVHISAVVLPLFFEQEHFGYIAINPVPEDDILCESLRREISTSIKGTLLIEKEKATSKILSKTLKALKDSYNKLEQLSVLDELTGLYNRRGFITLANEHIELSRRKHRDFLLFFIDLDGLKGINDKFGHKEGDNALIMVAKVLTKTFRYTDIVARIGGDEFTALAVDCTINELERITTRLKYDIEEINKNLNKPYKISFSYGVAPYRSDNFHKLEELMEEADRNLYKEKNKKKGIE